MEIKLIGITDEIKQSSERVKGLYPELKQQLLELSKEDLVDYFIGLQYLALSSRILELRSRITDLRHQQVNDYFSEMNSIDNYISNINSINR